MMKDMDIVVLLSGPIKIKSDVLQNWPFFTTDFYMILSYFSMLLNREADL